MSVSEVTASASSPRAVVFCPSQVRKDYNFMGDKATGPIIILVYLLLVATKTLCIRFAEIVGLWRRAVHEGTVDDDIARKLAIGEGNEVRRGNLVYVCCARGLCARVPASVRVCRYWVEEGDGGRGRGMGGGGGGGVALPPCRDTAP